MDTVINIKDFTTGRGSGEDTSLAVFLALEECRKETDSTLVFPKGIYHFYPDKAYEELYCISNHGIYTLKKCAFPIKKINSITIDGDGSDFIFHGSINPFVVDFSSNVTLKNFSIDWERPMITQGLVLKSEDNYIEVKISQEYPYRIENNKIIFIGEGWEQRGENIWSLMEIDSKTNAPAYMSGDGIGAPIRSLEAEEIQPGIIRFKGNIKRKPAVGNNLLFRHGDRYNPGIFIKDSKDIDIIGVNLYSANGMGVIAQKSENINILKTNILPTPGSDRAFSVDADATHFVNCRGLVKLEECNFQLQMDDPLNIHGIYGRIIERRDDHTLLITLVHEMQKGVEFVGANDDIRLIRCKDLSPYGKNVVKECKRISKDYMLVTVVNPLPENIEENDTIENMSWNAELIIRNCNFKANRARGPLISTPRKALVENNVFNIPGCGILIEGDSNYWFESGAVEDVTIRNNTFLECTFGNWGSAVIQVTPGVKEPEKAECYHRNIRIEGNTFKLFDSNLLYAHSVDGISFKNNIIESSDMYKKHGLMTHVIKLRACKCIDISCNEFPQEYSKALIEGVEVDLREMNEVIL
jgi:hypothetical protein